MYSDDFFLFLHQYGAFLPLIYVNLNVKLARKCYGICFKFIREDEDSNNGDYKEF